MPAKAGGRTERLGTNSTGWEITNPHALGHGDNHIIRGTCLPGFAREYAANAAWEEWGLLVEWEDEL